jgi:hypothetical protein
MTAKSRKAVIILSAVLVLIIAAGILAAVLPGLLKSGGDESFFSISSPVRISWSGSGFDQCGFILEDGVWYYSENKDYPIKQSDLAEIASLLTELEPSRSFDPSDELSSYGLDADTYTLTAEDENGSEFILHIGALAGDGACYAMTGSSDKIYVISSDIEGSLEGGLYEKVESETISAPTLSDVAVLTITMDGITASFTHEIDDEDMDVWYYLAESGEYVAEENFSAVGSDGEEHTVRKYLNDIEDIVSSLRSSGCCGYLCTDAELENMGLGSTALKAEFTMSDGTVKTYIIGSEFSDDTDIYSYFTMDGLSGVYKMSSSASSPLFEAVTALGR